MPYADLEKRRSYDRAWAKADRIENREKHLKRQAAWRLKNKEKIRGINAAYQANNRRKLNERFNIRHRTDLNFRLPRYLRNRIYQVLQGKAKSARTLALLGCSIEFLRQYLEKQFRPGMTWENYGPIWHVDHVLPCAKFHLQHSEEQEVCFHWTNLQPLFASDNLSKSDKII